MAKYFTPFNGPQGQEIVSDTERFNEGKRRQSIADQMAAAALTAQLQMHEKDLADRASGRGMELADRQAGREQQGSQFDKGFGLTERQTEFDMAQRPLDRAQRLQEITANQAPQMGRLDLEREQFNATNWKNEMAKKYLEKRLGKLTGGGGASVGATGGMPGNALVGAGNETQGPGGGGMGGEDENDLISMIFGGQPMQSRQQRELGKIQLTEASAVQQDNAKRRIREQQQELLDAGLPDAARKLDPNGSLPIANLDDFVAKNPNLGSELGSQVGKFYAADVGDFDADPGASARQKVVNERNNMVSALTRKGYPYADALRQANRVVLNNLGDEADDWEAENVQLLKQDLGL